MEKYNVTAVSLVTRSQMPLIIEENDENADLIGLSTCVDGLVVSASNSGYFQSYQELRDKLLQLGYGLKCAGSRLNAVQSPMASGSDKIFLVSLGKQAAMKDLFSLYEYTDIDIFPDTEEQNAFSQKWFTSLKKW